VVVVGEREDAFAGVGGADAEVVHAAGAADGHFAFGVEPVVAEAVVGVGVGRGGDFGGGAVGVAWGSAVQRSVWALLVVALAELIERALQLRGAGGRWTGSEPALQGLVEPFGLALGYSAAAAVTDNCMETT
jgi:hypothetical protein